jgi:hypothetical protein
MFGHVFIKLSVERERESWHLQENKREMKCVVGKKEPFQVVHDVSLFCLDV